MSDCPVAVATAVAGNRTVAGTAGADPAGSSDPDRLLLLQRRQLQLVGSVDLPPAVVAADPVDSAVYLACGL